MTAISPRDTTDPGMPLGQGPGHDAISRPRGLWFHIPLALLAVVSALLLYVLVSQRPGWVDSPLIGKPAPGLRGTDTHGRVFDSARHSGRVVIVGFAAMDCKPSLDAMAAWRRIQATLRDEQRVCIVALCWDGSRERINGFIKSADIRYSVLAGPNASAVRDYRVGAIPRTVMIRPDGHVGRVYEGYHPDMVDLICTEVRRLLSEPVDAPGRTGPHDRPVPS